MDEEIDSLSAQLWSSLRNYWANFLADLPRIILAIFILALISFVAVRMSRLINQRLSSKEHDKLFSTFITNLIKYALIICGVMIALQILGLSGIAGGMLAGAGVSALIFGFAFRDIGENFLAGIILAFNRPFNLHDTIKIDDYIGRIEALNFRTTHIKTFDEKDVYIPNSVIIKQPLTNLTRDGQLRIDFIIGLGYENDVEDALALIVTTILKSNEILLDPKPFAVVEEFSISTINIRAFFWISTDDYRRGVLITKSDLMNDVKKELIKHGFSLPANIVELRTFNVGGTPIDNR